ncbi:uncharacterized protein Z519_00821 [Cladophialophora bantiana CBS 173.52]|uniref:Uncharacterized protein n=1 Tax=Cladophialophora bantiana (strain ATCC 10958 / CBS 173.52 / CDC B-1940 / NIH 8579) TaxID=1442370 RepID=A0A0D2I0B4_CLAB1|nr:uncharacterized protein Z519_00821 [Cladophialophora bantiana CBS 173.52]KIW99158.1 hypothetical protein Z519_00821 [Cladophialophora bantiana CBS 173.52]
MFSGTILKRPHTIDKTHINVLLPVSDEAWFSDTPAASVAVIPDPIHGLVSYTSFLRAFAHDIIHRRHTTAQTICDFQSAIACFSLILPQRFHLSANCLSFDESNFAVNNWIVCTHLILHSSRASLRLLCHRKFPEHLDVFLETSALEDEKLICHVIREWDPSSIAQTYPLVTTTLLGPGAINAKTACEFAASPDESRPIYLEMLKLVLGAIGSFWQIRASVLGESSQALTKCTIHLTTLAELVQLLEARRSITQLVNARNNDLDLLPPLLTKNDEDPGKLKRKGKEQKPSART